jgi:hypothetical protein
VKPKIHPDVRRLITQVDAYRARHGIDRTRFGLLAANDGHLIERWLSGRLPRLTTMDRVRKYIEQNDAQKG